MFEVQDVSHNTDDRVIGPRRLQSRLGIMLHTTDGTNSLSWLQGGSARAGKPASADVLVDRMGNIKLLIPPGHYAYHAGRCWWQGSIDESDEVSRRFIGVEIENADSRGSVPTYLQHRAVAGLCLVCAAGSLSPKLSVIGHYGVAYPMGRRSDPRGWDWGYMFWLMAHAKETIQLYGATHRLKEL